MKAIDRRQAMLLVAAVAAGCSPSFATEGEKPPLAALGGFDCSDVTVKRGKEREHEGLSSTDILRASSVLAGTPLYCGRYFSGTTQSQTLCQSDDIAVLERFEIPLLLIARQTTQVVKADAKLAYQQAHMNVSEFLRIFRSARHGATIISQLKDDQAKYPDRAVRFYLDVEPYHPLNAEYYSGWIEGLKDAGFKAGVDFIPAVYAPEGDQATLDVLNNAVQKNSGNCSGLWIARYDFGERARALGCRSMSLEQTLPISTNTEIPVLLHQYAECDERIDISYLTDSSKDSAVAFFHTLVRTWVLTKS